MRLGCLMTGRLRSGGRGVFKTTQKLEHNHPGVIVLDQVAWKWTSVDFSIPWDKNIVNKEDEKITKHSPLGKEITKLQWVSAAKVVPLVVGYSRGFKMCWVECRHLICHCWHNSYSTKDVCCLISRSGAKLSCIYICSVIYAPAQIVHYK